MLDSRQGFTLLELLTATAIISILLLVAPPYLRHFILNNEAQACKNTMHRLAAQARATALIETIPIKLCGINDLLQCTKSNFDQVALFADTNKNNSVDSEEKLIRIHQFNYSGKIRLTASLGKPYIEFKHDGSSAQAGSFIFCQPENKRYSNRVTISMSGRAYYARDLDGDGYIDLVSGEPIRC